MLDEPDDLFGGESTLHHVRPLGLTDFTASRGTAQWGQVTREQNGVADADNTPEHDLRPGQGAGRT